MKKYRDLTGEKFGRWTVVERDCLRPKGVHVFWICRCECGTMSSVDGNNLKNGHSKSCGCGQWGNKRGNGNWRKRLYRIWSGMIARTENKRHTVYSYYGGRGIKVCDEWRNDYKVFESWAEQNGYKDNLTIDRKDVNGDYCPENCRWATKKEQQRNKRNTVYVNHEGQNVSLATVCEQYGINVDTVRDKLKNGRSLENAINTSAQAVTWDEHLLRLKEKRKGELDELLQYFLENPESSNRKTARAMGWSVRKVQRMKADLRADGKHLPE